jgi:hypothetical protein
MITPKNLSKFRLFKLAITLIILSCYNQLYTKITPSHEFSMEIIDQNSIRFNLTNIGSKQGWVGVGFGGHLMENVDYHIFTWINGGFSFADSWSHEYESPRDDRSYGGTLDIAPNQTVEGSDRHVTYLRKTNTNDKYDYTFVDGDNPFVVAWWFDEGMDKHGSFVKVGNINMNFQTKTVSISVKAHVPYEVHGIVLLISWTILNGLGYMAGRMLKHLPFFKWFHLFTSGLNGLLTLIFGIVGLVTSKLKKLLFFFKF